jgi:hypothetical protein
MRLPRALILPLAAILAACSSSADDSASGDQADTSRHGADDILATSEGGLQLLQGYNYVFDRGATGAPCVGYDGTPRVQVTNLTSDLSVNYVSSLSNLEEQLGIDAAISVKADVVGGGGLTSKYTQSFSQGRSSYHYLLKATQRYDVVIASAVKMASQPNGADAFLNACGDSYVHGLRYGAALYVLMTIDAPTETQAHSLAVGIQADVSKQVAKVGANGTASANVTSGTTSTQSQLNVSLTAQTVGFNPREGATAPIAIPTSTGGTVVPDTLTAISGYVDLLAKSVKDDMSKETQQGVNPARQAVPTQVIRGRYELTPGFDAAHNPMNDLNTRLLKAATYLNNLTYMKGQLDDVYYDEIQAFLGADDLVKAKFNVAPPGSPQPNTNAVARIVQQQETIFKPAGVSGSYANNVTAGIRKLIYACRDSSHTIQNGALSYADCTQDATKQPEYIAALDALDKYAAASRVLATKFYGGEDSWSTSCSKASQDAGATLKLVDKVQVAELAPSVAADPKGCAWYNDTSCGFLTGGEFKSSTTEAASDTTKAENFTCATDLDPFTRCAAFCVPPDGVFGVPRLLGRGAPQH